MSEYASDPSETDFQAPETGGVTPQPELKKYPNWVELAKQKIQEILQSKLKQGASAEPATDQTGVESPADQVEAETPQQEEIKALTEAVLAKISEQLGSNPGGWYEHQETHEKYYVKYYDNPDRARVEFVANAVYAQLGIPAAKSELFETDDGRLAIAAKEIPGTEAATGEQMRASQDVRSGFLADAFLANWDVVGLVNDNIVQGSDGRMHRIDNGGSLIYRAQGGAKNYSGSEIPELQTMLNPEYSAGKVFAGMTEEELHDQAQNLVNRIDKAFIDQIIAQAGLSGEVAEQVREGLKGRLQFIKERFGVEKEETEPNPWQGVVERLRTDAERVKGVEFRGHTDVTIDKDKIEGQRLDIIDARDAGYYTVYFKLTQGQYDQMVQKMHGMSEAYGSRIAYPFKDNYGYDQQFDVTQAWTIETEDLEIRIAMPNSSKDVDKGNGRAGLGLVEIKIKTTEELTPEMIREKLEKAFEKLELQEALTSPDDEAERKFKIARYCWQQKIDEASLTPEDIARIEANLQRQEVFPGYSTMVEPGKSKEYAEIVPFAIQHGIYNENALIKIIRAGGLIATQERFRRGSAETGMSSGTDMDTGGADSVFTRIITENDSMSGGIGHPQIIFNPDILDRTDWYSYETDKYGSTAPSYFSSRLTPEELLQRGKNHGLPENNEQMFRYGIPLDKMLGVVVEGNTYVEDSLLYLLRSGGQDVDSQLVGRLIDQGPSAIKAECQSRGIDDYMVGDFITSDARLRLIDKLNVAGIQEVNGIPVEEFITTGQNRKDLIKLTQERLGQE